MGDNRYYTYPQFFKILFLMILLAALIVIITILFYRNKRKKKVYGMLFILSMVTCITFVNFLEAVIFTTHAGFLLRWVECFCLFGIPAVMMVYFSSGHRIWYTIPIVYYFSFLLLLIYPGGEAMITRDSLTEVQYGAVYGFLQIAGLILCFIALLSQKRKKNIPGNIVFMALSMPLVYNAVFTIMKGTPSGYIYLYFVTGAIVYNVMLFKMPTLIMTKNIDEIEKWLNEGIIITNELGDVLFTNLRDHSLEEIVCVPIEMDVDEPTKIFTSNGIAIHEEENGYSVFLPGTENRTLYMTKTNLYTKNKLLGYLFIIEDTTLISGVLTELKNKNREHQEKNQSLQDYAKIAYKYEMEKEINLLTNEMNDRIGHQMVELSLVCQKAYLEVEQNTKEAPDAMVTTMQLAKKILTSVREAVSTYRNFYKR